MAFPKEGVHLLLAHTVHHRVSLDPVEIPVGVSAIAASETLEKPNVASKIEGSGHSRFGQSVLVATAFCDAWLFIGTEPTADGAISFPIRANERRVIQLPSGQRVAWRRA